MRTRRSARTASVLPGQNGRGCPQYRSVQCLMVTDHVGIHVFNALAFQQSRQDETAGACAQNGDWWAIANHLVNVVVWNDIGKLDSTYLEQLRYRAVSLKSVLAHGTSAAVARIEDAKVVCRRQLG